MTNLYIHKGSKTESDHGATQKDAVTLIGYKRALILSVFGNEIGQHHVR